MSQRPVWPADEERRLARLRELAVLDTGPEAVFDTLAQLAAQVCAAPIALVSLVYQDRQWFKACIGLPSVPEMPRGASFCSHAIIDKQLLEVPDAQADPRFASDPMVTGVPFVRFYAGAPLVLPSGESLGTLCVIDHVPRRLTEQQKGLLVQLAAAVTQVLQMRENVVTRVAAATAKLDDEFRVLAEFSPVGVFLADSQGRGLYTNAAWQRISGLSLTQSLGDGWMQAVHGDDLERMRRSWLAATVSGDDFQLEYRMRRPDGSVRDVNVRARVVCDAEGRRTGWVGTVQDETERFQTLKRLADQRQLLDRAGRLAGVGAWEVDLPAQKVTWSEQTCLIHDRPVIYQPTIDEGIAHFVPEVQPLLREVVDRGMFHGEPWDLELPLITATGRHVWVRVQGEAQLENGKPVRLFGAVQDITARREAASRLRDLYEKTPAMLQSLDMRGVITSVSDLWLSKTGYRRDEVIGRRGVELLTPASRQHMWPLLREQIQRTGRVDNMPLQMLCAGGRVMDISYSMRVHYDQQGQAEYAVGVIEDLTDVVARNAELERERLLREQLQRQAEALSRLADERREMLDVLAHEVRQPLNNASAALQSATGLLADRANSGAGERLLRANAVIRDVTHGLDNTLAAAALLASGRHISVQDSDIEMLVQMAIGDLPPAQRMRVRVRREGGSRTAAMDSMLMRLALRNLLANAMRHAPAGSTVELSVIDSEDPLGLMFEVADSGVGVAEQVRERLFERASRGPGSHGQGLGLYIVRRVMELHSGRAELAESAPGRTVFRLWLGPLDPA